jgi:hypothetical protein
MKAAMTAMCLVVLAGCVVLPTGAVPPPSGGAVAPQARERFTFPSTTTRATLAYSCRPGAEGGGPAARAQATHAVFDQALSGFAARQAAASIAAVNAGRSGESLDAELKAQGDAFAAQQRADLDARYGCIPAGGA